MSAVFAAALAFALVPLTAASAAAAPTVVGVALDAQGKPLKYVQWDIYSQQNGKWVGLQFGPKLTDANGRFSNSAHLSAGTKYRICFSDTYYGEDPANDSSYWYPETRHRDTCWGGAESVENAQDWTATEGSTTFTVTMPDAGLGMAAVEPFVVGSYEVDKPLTVVGQEGWRPTNATLSYQWFTDSGSGLTPIAGATAATYTPTDADDGKWILAGMSGTLSGYKTAQLLSQMTKVGGTHAQLTSPLKITGTPAAGNTLTASYGKPTASNHNGIDWLVDGVPQPAASTQGQSSATFTVTSAMAGARIEARLWTYLTDPIGNYLDGSNTYVRAVVQAQGVRPPQPAPIETAPALASTPVSGITAVGGVLTAPTPSADPAATTTYQWLRDGVAIPGATAASYQLQAADVGRRISVAATVSRPGWWNGFLRISTDSQVVQGVASAGKAKIKGRAVVGAKLKVKAKGWQGLSLSYQWMRNGKPIKPAKKATKKAYKVKKKDRGKRITVVVTGAKELHVPATKTSKAKKIKR